MHVQNLEERTEPAGAATLSEEAICAWLAGQVARLVGTTPEAVNIQQTFAHYGLDSMQAARLSGDLETLVGRELPPSLIYDFPTIEAVARYLAAPAGNGEPMPAL